MLLNDEIQELTHKLNTWLQELNQKDIVPEYINNSEKDEYSFKPSQDLKDPSKWSLNKLTRCAPQLQQIFSSLPGIKTLRTRHSLREIFSLVEIENNAFKNFNTHFLQILRELKMKAKQLTVSHSFSFEDKFISPNRFEMKVDPILEEVLATQKEEVRLDSVNFVKFKDTHFVRLQEKLQSKPHTLLSLQFCNIDKLPNPIFDKIVNIIAHANIKKIDLSNNQLHKLDVMQFQALLTALKNENIKEVYLNANDLGFIFKDHPNLLISFLEDKVLDRLGLSGNKITDDVAKIIAQYSKNKWLLLGENPISDVGADCFNTNSYMTLIDMADTTTSDGMRKKLDKRASFNFKRPQEEKLLVAQAIALAQGHKNEGNLFHKLPREIISQILTILYNGLRKPLLVQRMLQLVMDNVSKSKPGHLVWNKEVELTEGKLITIFKKRQTLRTSLTSSIKESEETDLSNHSPILSQKR